VVRLGLACPSINLKTCRVDDVVADAVCFEQTVQPEIVVARLIARNQFYVFLRFSGNSRPDPLAQIQEFPPIAGHQRVAANLIRQGCLTATMQLFLFNSISARQRTVSSWEATVGRTFTTWASISVSYGAVG